jgi:hypothetical protein
MLNSMSIITEKVRMAGLEASNSPWPMGTTEPRQGISVACTCIDWVYFDQYGGTPDGISTVLDLRKEI